MNTRTWRWPILTLPLLLAVGARAEQPTLPPELAWVPQNSMAFVHIRFAELWNSPVGRDAAKIIQSVDPKALDEAEKQLGFPLSRLDRITVLLPDLIQPGREPGFVIRLTTTKPYNRQDVMAAAFRSHRPGNEPPNPPVAGEFLHTEGGVMVHLTDDRNITYVLSKEGALGLLGKFLGGTKAGPLAGALMLAAGPNQVVASVNVAKLPRIPVDQLPPELKGLRPLLDAKTVTVVANLGPEAAKLEATIAFGSKEDAAEGAQALEEGRKLLLNELTEAERHTDADPAAKLQLELLKEIQNAVKSAQVEARESAVHVAANLGVTAAVTKILAEGTGSIRTSAARTQSQNNLKQMGLAFHNFQSTYNVLPAAAICDKNGKPLLSWRVAILPYMEQDNLYKQFHLDEPWDSDHNIKLIQQMPKIYMLPNDAKKHELPSTYYQVFVGETAAFDWKKGRVLPRDFPDGLSNTVWLVEAADAVPWTKPADLEYDGKKLPKIGYHFNGTCNVGFADGSVRVIKKTMPENIWHLLIQRDDGQPIPNIP
ncbi:MAG: DUF1559 domain-containing protein [Gemmataceae bacterium]